MNEILQVAGLKRSFTQGGVTIEVLRGVNLSVGQGEIVALLGPWVSVKSSVLPGVGLLVGGFDGSFRIGVRKRRSWTMTGERGCGGMRLVSFTNSIICCRTSTQWRMSYCRR